MQDFWQYLFCRTPLVAASEHWTSLKMFLFYTYLKSALFAPLAVYALSKGFQRAVIIMVLVRKIWVLKRLKLCLTCTKIIFGYNINWYSEKCILGMISDSTFSLLGVFSLSVLRKFCLYENESLIIFCRMHFSWLLVNLEKIWTKVIHKFQ